MSETHWQGCDTVHPDCHHPALLALAGLIAELRDPRNYTTRTVLADNAEQRLRDVTSGEPCPCGNWHTRLPCCGVPDTDCERANGDFSGFLSHAANCGKPRRTPPEDWTDVIEEAKRWGFE